VGEGGCIIGPPTLVNAIADALAPFDVRCTDLPLTPSKILELIEHRVHQRRPSRWAEKPVAEPADMAPAPIPPAADLAAPAEPPAPAGPVGLDGIWKISISAPMGSQEMKGRFVADGGVLTGTLYSEMGDQAFTGTIAGDTLKWEMKIDKPMAMTLKYDVQVQGDRMTGKVKMGMFGTAKLVGERA
jgi:carbon-monoxide dehydrogenase large subunit